VRIVRYQKMCGESHHASSCNITAVVARTRRSPTRVVGT
jgi:hypothetical protein